MAELNVELSKYIPILRVFQSSDWPQPSPAGIILNTVVDGATYYWPSAYRKVTFTNGEGTPTNVPAFYGQVLSSNISEDEKHAFSIDMEFPYGQTLGGNNLYSNELSVFYPKRYSIGEVTYVTKGGALDPEVLDTIKPFFNVSDLNPSYLYRVDIVDQTDSNIIAALNTYYTTSTEANLIALDKVINTASKEHYWCYLTDYTINKTNKDSTITLNFIDPSYKLSTSWNDLKIPESTFLSWINNQTDVKTHLADSRVLAALSRGEYPPVFDGWKLSGYLLAILYYSYMFPAISLNALTLNRSVVGDYAVYTITYNETKTVTLLKIHTDVEAVSIPISSKYPETDPLVSNGFYNEIPPFQYMSDTLNTLAELIGFFWIFNRKEDTSSIANDCMLIITSESYPIPATTYDLTGTNTYKSTYDFDDSNLRNNVSVFGRPYGLNLQYGATVSVDESVDLFGYKNFVLESPLILSGASAEGVAKNILNNYAFNIGTVDVDMPYTELVQLNQPIVLDIDAKYNTNGNNVYVYSRNITMTRFKKSDMTLYLGPKVERTIINFGDVLTNISDKEDGANNIQFMFKEDTEIPAGYTTLVNPANVVTNLGAKAGFRTISISSDIFVAKEYAHNYTKKVSAGETITFKATYEDKNGNSKTLQGSHTYTSSGSYTVRVVFRVVFVLSWYADVSVKVLWEWEPGTINYRGPQFGVEAITAKKDTYLTMWYESSKTESLGSLYYVPYELNHDVKFYAKFEMQGSVENYGLVEGGFLVIPLAPAGRDGSNVPFNGLTIDGGKLQATSAWNMDNYTLDQVLNEIQLYLADGFEITDDGTLITYGNIANVSGIDPSAELSSITTSIKTNLYLALDGEDNINPEFTLQFTPMYNSDLGRLTYANLMLIVPFVRGKTKQGDELVNRLFPKTPMFLLHGKVPSDVNDRIVMDYVSGGKLTYSDVFYTKTYQVSYHDTGSIVDVGNGVEDAYSLTNVSGGFYGSFKYKSKFPFVLNLALNKGWTRGFNVGNVIEYSDIKQASHFYYKQLLKASDDFTTTTIYPFSDLEGVVKWISDMGNQRRLSLVMFADPFYMYSISQAINNPDSTQGVVGGNPDRLKLTPYLIASMDSTTPNANALGTFINAYRARYVINARTDIPKIADILIIDYNVSNFQ